MRPSPTTLVLAMAAVVSVGLVHFDPWETHAGVTFVSTKTAARRVFPDLGNRDPSGTEVVIDASDGRPVRLVPGAHGHVVMVGDTVLGPADPEALEGLWGSLRMATTLRAVPPDLDVGPVRRGRIVLRDEEGSLELELGGETPDGVGLYGTLAEGGETSVWVVEEELGAILDQAPEAWLARRAVVAEPQAIDRLDFGALVVERGLDGWWRSNVRGQQAMLDTDGVRVRIDRILSARLDPLLPRDAASDGEEETTAWLGLRTVEGQSIELRLGGRCPGHPGRVVLDRGPGWVGCIDAILTEPWPVPGNTAAADASLVEPRLLPHPIGRVLSVTQRRPAARTLRRNAGDWVLEEREGERAWTADVGRAEVFAWYQALHDADVEPIDAALDELRPDVELRVDTDATVSLTLRCGLLDGNRVCRRDEGPLLRLRSDAVDLAFDRATFSPRTLVELAAEDARALEILPGPGSEGVRQSAHFDLGIWRLDAPLDPGGDAALDEVALEDMIAALASARARAWVDVPRTPPLRTIRLERTPRRGQDAEIVVHLHPDCVAVVDGRAAALDEGTCGRLQEDLVVDEPLRNWIATARALELTEGQHTIALRREGETWVRSDGQPIGELRERIEALTETRAARLRASPPKTSATTTLRILPEQGAAVVVHLGPDWVEIEGRDWHWLLE